LLKIKKQKGEVLIYTLNKTPPLFFTGWKLRPARIGIKATVQHTETVKS